LKFVGFMDTSQPDLVDEHFRPFVRALGNLVLTFALAEASLLEIVAEMLGGDEIAAVSVLKSQDAKEQVLDLVQTIGLQGYDLEEMQSGVGAFWADKAIRNRLIHDEWFPNIYERTVATRGLTRTKTPEEVYGTPEVDDIWRLALRFREYGSLFSHRSWALRKARGANDA
jgi:hypothetical protein